MRHHVIVAATLLLAASPAAQAQQSYDGVWSVRRDVSANCPPDQGEFSFRVKGSTIVSAGGGSISPGGSFTFTGKDNVFIGQFSGSSARGTFRGRCDGTFSARRG
jgi:hypothetical protein